MTVSCTIIVFARLPTPGRVKTRLAAAIGPNAAADWYAACAEYAINICSRCREARTVVYHSSQDRTEDVEKWLSKAGLRQRVAAVLPQSLDADLGQKMCSAFKEQFCVPGTWKVLITGTDIPGINLPILQAALSALDTHQAVLGPAKDGGYYLLGLTSPAPALLQGISWSTSGVLSQTLSQAASAGLQVAPTSTLPELTDIDTLPDLVDWWQEAASAVQPCEPDGQGHSDSSAQEAEDGSQAALRSATLRVLEGTHSVGQHLTSQGS